MKRRTWADRGGVRGTAYLVVSFAPVQEPPLPPTHALPLCIHPPQRSSGGRPGRPLLRVAFVLGGFLAFALAFPTLIPSTGRGGNVTALCACLGLALTGELARGLMTLTNIRGHRVLLPVVAVATLTAFIAVAVGLPGSGESPLCVRAHMLACLAWHKPCCVYAGRWGKCVLAFALAQAVLWVCWTLVKVVACAWLGCVAKS